MSAKRAAQRFLPHLSWELKAGRRAVAVGCCRLPHHVDVESYRYVQLALARFRYLSLLDEHGNREKKPWLRATAAGKVLAGSAIVNVVL